MPFLRIQASMFQNRNLSATFIRPNSVKLFYYYFGDIHSGHGINRNRSKLKAFGLMFQEYWTTKCSSRDQVSSNWHWDGTELFCHQLLKPNVFILCLEVKGYTLGPPLADSFRCFTPEQITSQQTDLESLSTTIDVTRATRIPRRKHELCLISFHDFAVEFQTNSEIVFICVVRKKIT